MATKKAAKKSAAKTSVKKVAAKKTATKKSAAKKSTRKYGAGVGKKVETEMREFNRGELKSGSGKKVTDRKQAIAIALSEARKEGKKVPPAPKKNS